MAVYEVLKQIMNDRGLSIAEIARVCDLPDSTVRGIIRREQNSIALDVAFKLSDGLQISLERLNGMPEHKEAPTPEEPDAGASQIDASKLYKLLVDNGLVANGEDLSDSDLRFLLSVGEALRTWFAKSDQ